MINELAHREIGELKARCMMLESRVSALAAFACALLDSNPRKDELQTRWSKHLGPALHQFSGLGEDQKNSGIAIPAWVEFHLSGKSGDDPTPS